MNLIEKSPWIIHYDGSSCNGCDIEVLACLTPRYDIERFGAVNMGNPKHSDILLITGSVNNQNREVIRIIYEQMGDPKVVVAIGACGGSGGIFRECYNTLGGVEAVIPVDLFIPGCPPRPEAIIDGLIEAVALLKKKKTRHIITHVIGSGDETRELPMVPDLNLEPTSITNGPETEEKD